MNNKYKKINELLDLLIKVRKIEMSVEEISDKLSTEKLQKNIKDWYNEIKQRFIELKDIN